jgi:hypothetical protein
MTKVITEVVAMVKFTNYKVETHNGVVYKLC